MTQDEFNTKLKLLLAKMSALKVVEGLGIPKDSVADQEELERMKKKHDELEVELMRLTWRSFE